MVKTKMSFKKIMTQSHYSSIIKLTNIYQKKENGLQQMHYRYALQENYNIPKHYKKKMKAFFSDEKLPSLDDLYKTEFIYRDCIKTQTLLSNFLKKLTDDYKLLTRKIDRYGKYKYFVSPTLLNEFSRSEVKQSIDEYPKDFINTIGPIERIGSDVDTPYKSYFDGCIFGLPTMYEKYVTEEDNKQIKQSLINIYKELNKINNIKLKYMDGASHFSFYGKVVIDPKIKEYMDTVEATVKKMKKFKNGFRG